MQTWPTPYSCKLMEAGIISYEDSGAGIAYLTKQTIDKIAPSIIGRPVVVRHQKVTPENTAEVAVGYVTGVHFEAADAWFYVDFLITSDKVTPIEKDGCVVFKAPDGQILDGISGAYDVTNTADGGVWHDIQFDAEILDGSFTHLALVVNPRYEETNKIRETNFMLVNGKVAKQNALAPVCKECLEPISKGEDVGHVGFCKSCAQKKNAKMLCVECGASFSHNNPSVETKCPKCHGYDVEVANAVSDQIHRETCTTCKGKGTQGHNDCPDCMGRGWNSKENAVDRIKSNWHGHSFEIKKSGEQWIASCDELGLKSSTEKTADMADNVMKKLIDDKEKTNSKGGSPMKNLFSIFRKLANGKEEEVDKVVVIDGQEVPLKELVHTYEAEETEKTKKAELDLRMAKDDEEIEIGDKKVKVGDLKNGYMAKMAKKNAKEDEGKKKEKSLEEIEKEEQELEDKKAREAGKKNEKGEDEDKEKADKDAKDKADEEAKNEKIPADEGVEGAFKDKKDREEKEEKKNSKQGDKFFDQVENAGKGPVVEEAVGGPRTRGERAEMGRARYGSKQEK